MESLGAIVLALGACGSHDVDHAPPPPPSSSVAAGSPANAVPARPVVQLVGYGISLPRHTADHKATAIRILEQRFPMLAVVVKPGKLPDNAIGVATTDGRTMHLSGMVRDAHGLDARAIGALDTNDTLIWLKWRLVGEGAVARVHAIDMAVDAIATATGGTVFDMNSLELFSPAAWRESRVATWDGDIPHASAHFKIAASPGASGYNLTTYGLGAFALPELVLTDVPEVDAKRAASLCNAIGQLWVEGGASASAGDLAIDLHELRYAKAGPLVDPTHAAGLVHATLTTGAPHSNALDERTLEVHFPASPGATDGERITAALDALFGSQPDVPTSIDENDRELRYAPRNARQQPDGDQPHARGGAGHRAPGRRHRHRLVQGRRHVRRRREQLDPVASSRQAVI
jgi:hypothetical protein